MKYDDIIDAARAQDAGPTPGPDFPALMGAAAATKVGLSKSALAWLAGLLGGAAVVTVAVVVLDDPSPAPQPTVTEIAEATVPGEGIERETAQPEPEPALVEPVGAPEQAEEPPLPDEPTPAPDDAERPDAAKPSPTAPEDPESLYTRSERNMKAGNLKAAHRDLRRIVRKFPDWSRHSTALIDLARLESRMGRKQSATCSYRDFVRKYPRDMMTGEAKKALARLETDPDVDSSACR